MLKNLKLKYQIMIPSLIFGAIITSLSLHGMGQLLKIDLKLSFAQHLETVIEERSNRIELYLDMLKAHMSGVSTDSMISACLNQPTSPNCDQETLSAYILKSKLPNIPSLAELDIIDIRGQLLASSLLTATRGADWSETNEFTQGKQRNYISNIYQSSTTEEYIINIASPVLENSRLIGVVTGKFRANALFDIAADPSGLETTGDLYLVDKDSIRITPSRFNDQAIMEKIASDDLTECLADYKKYGSGAGTVESHDESIVTMTNANGKKILGTHGYVPGQQWCMLAEMTESEVMEPLTSLRWIFIVVGFVVMAGITFFVLWHSASVTRPTAKLLTETKTIVMGHYDHRINSDRKDEVGQLAMLIDHLAEHIKKPAKKE